MSFDLPFTLWIQQFDGDFPRRLMIFISWLGPTIVPLTFITVVLMWFKNRRRDGLFILIYSLPLYLWGEILKIVVHRPRPDPSLIHQYLPELKPDSFPSGHVLFYIGLLMPLMILAGKYSKGLVKYGIWGAAVGLILLIGLSRVYLGEHWLSDVLGSYLLGSLWLLLLTKVWRQKSGDPSDR